MDNCTFLNALIILLILYKQYKSDLNALLDKHAPKVSLKGLRFFCWQRLSEISLHAYAAKINHHKISQRHKQIARCNSLVNKDKSNY